MGVVIKASTLLLRELPLQPLTRAFDTPPYTVLVTLHTLHTRSAARAVHPLAARLHLIDQVPRASASNVVDWCLLAPQTFLLHKFLIKAEHGAFRLLHVAGTSSTGGVDGTSWWGRQLGA